jgi:hypothetical protein
MSNTKRVNIYPSTPIVNVTPIIRSIVKNANKDYETIRKCIIARAKVEEILPTGDLVVLDLNNYNKDNNFAKVQETVLDPIVEAAKDQTDVPVIDPAEAAKTAAPVDEEVKDPAKEAGIEEKKVEEPVITSGDDAEPVKEEVKEEAEVITSGDDAEPVEVTSGDDTEPVKEEAASDDGTVKVEEHTVDSINDAIKSVVENSDHVVQDVETEEDAEELGL